MSDTAATPPESGEPQSVPQPSSPPTSPPGPPPGAYAYPPVPGYPPPAYPVKPKANGFALTSMILGILGLTIGLCLLFFPVMPILAVVFGYVALGQMGKTGAPGRGYAIAGLVTGYIGIALALLWLIGSIIGTFTSPMPTF